MYCQNDGFFAMMKHLMHLATCIAGHNTWLTSISIRYSEWCSSYPLCLWRMCPCATERYVLGIWLFTTQKPVYRPGWWKGKSALFQMLATGGEGGGHLSKSQFPHPAWQAGSENFYRQNRGAGVTCRNSTVISNSHLQLVISGLTSIILVLLGTVNLQFWGALVPISVRQLSELWQLKSWIQSVHHVVNFSTLGFSIYKTAHRIWLRILSIALEKELTVPDYA